LSEDGPISSSDVRIRAFLKAEKRQIGNVAKPRMIYPRSPRYNLHLASWLKPFEHWLWGNLKSRAISGVGNSRVVAKGLNPRQRANLIVRKMSAFSDCSVFEVDGKAFEAHILSEQLELEHSVYLAAYAGDRELAQALARQLRNVGKTPSGIRFSRRGGRASGDFNTGMGNSLIMLAVVRATMSYLGVKKWDTLVDGDNALLFLPGATAQATRSRFGAAACSISGHEMTLERCVSEVEQIRFGQSAPVWVNGGWMMVRDWRKVVSQGTSSHAHLHEPRGAMQFCAGIARCEASLACGVPILWRWTNRLLHLTRTVRTPKSYAFGDYRMFGVDVDGVLADPTLASEPDVLTRASFGRAFGVTPDEQLAIESSLERVAVVVDRQTVWDEDFVGAWSVE
jgi:hypothetical protein